MGGQNSQFSSSNELLRSYNKDQWASKILLPFPNLQNLLSRTISYSAMEKIAELVTQLSFPLHFN